MQQMNMMANKRNISILLCAVLAAGFIYRLTLTTWNTFPPGADIGLHESVINSILAPKTTLLYNYYHMGGGISATNPGYHIFAAFIISFTGAPDYIVQAVVVSMFSTLIIAAAFLLVKQVWGELAGLVVAILVTFSASDILMLSWAGYPNIVALALIPVLFYLFLQPSKIALKSFTVAASLIVSALFLTHVFSAIVFLAVVALTLLVSVVLPKSMGFIENALHWLTPLFFGIILVSPYLISVFPLYFGSEGAITGAVSVMKQAVVETRVVPTVILGLAIIPIVLFLCFSKKQTGKFFTLQSILFSSAILVPLAAAQCYLFGFFLDYERFLYFLALPVMVCIGLIIVSASNIIAKALQNVKPKSSSHAKTIMIVVLVAVCLFTPLFALPNVAAAQASYFQVMNPTEYQAIQWIQNNTPPDSVCVADANFGWWLSGFAQRPTLSAVDPQFLILQREFAPAQVASNLLRADYLAENGIIQIEQAGPYANGSAHDIYAELANSVYKPLVCSINDTRVSMLYRDGGNPKEITLGAFTDSNTQVANDGNSTTFIISRDNHNLRVTEEITIFRGIRFAEVTFVFQNEGSINYDWVRIPFQARGELIQYGNSIGIVDNTAHWVNQIVLPMNQLGKDDVSLEENGDSYELFFNLHGEADTKLSFYVGLCPYNADSANPSTDYYNSLIANNSENYLNVFSNSPINCFDYRAAIRQWSISYVAVRNPEAISRFMNDPAFEVAFSNTQVTVFEVVGV
jgi:hypothetical protein